MSMKSPFDLTEMTPERIAALFDPQQFLTAFESLSKAGVAPTVIFESNKRNFEAMLAANKAAAEAYKDFYEKQMGIFNSLMQNAREQLESVQGLHGQELAEKQAEIMRSAVEQAFTLMTELSKAAKKANEDAYAIIKDRVEEAVDEMKSQ